ncbi:hypothetical protein J6590_051103 [Homalodisca vitripennis]|nr:hypothetical protein J6590_051103 [Homalodisca vitripennis]
MIFTMVYASIQLLPTDSSSSSTKEPRHVSACACPPLARPIWAFNHCRMPVPGRGLPLPYTVTTCLLAS